MKEEGLLESQCSGEGWGQTKHFLCGRGMEIFWNNKFLL